MRKLFSIFLIVATLLPFSVTAFADQGKPWKVIDNSNTPSVNEEDVLDKSDPRTLDEIMAEQGTIDAEEEEKIDQQMAKLGRSQVNVVVNKELVIFPDARPFIDNKINRTLIPIRFVVEKLGADVDWDQSQKKVTIKKNGNTIELIIGQTSAKVNGKQKSFDASAILEKDRTYVPLRFISETIGANVKWVQESRIVDITVNKDSPLSMFFKGLNMRLFLIGFFSLLITAFIGFGLYRKRTYGYVFWYIFIFVFFFTSVIPPVYADDWPEFRGSKNRTGVATDVLGFPVREKWAVDLGPSASTPVIVGDKIYYIAGNSLWCLNAKATEGALPEELVVWEASNVNGGNISGSHVTYSQENGVLYVGTGTPTIDAYDFMGKRLGRVNLSKPIVTAPLAFPGDTVVFGAKDGYTYIVHGLKSGKPVVNKKQLTGWVTSSPVPLGTNAFAIAADGALVNGKVHGVVDAFYIKSSGHNDFDHFWPQKFITPYGVPASLALDGGSIYLADKKGTIYCLNKDYGTRIWQNLVFRSTRTFINNSPAVDDARVYIGFRSNKEGTSGMIAAYNKTNGGLIWYKNLQGWNNISPIVWPNKANAVLTGDTGGRIQAWNRVGGSPVYFANDKDGKPTNVIRLTDNPYVSPEFWNSASGASTEFALAKGSTDDGLLLMGANSIGPDGKPTGTLFAYSVPSNTVNLKLVNAYIEPSGNLQPGTAATAHVTAVNESDKIAVNTDLLWYLDGFKQLGTIPYIPADTAKKLEPGQSIDLSFNFTVPEDPDHLTMNLNYTKATPPDEITYEDNVAVLPVNTAQPNLSIHSIQFEPFQPLAGREINLSVAVTSDQSKSWQKPITTSVAWYVDDKYMGTVENIYVNTPGTVRIGNGRPDGANFRFTAPQGKNKVTVKFVVNPNRDKPKNEATWEDNIVKETIFFGNTVDLYVKSLTGGVFPVSTDITTKVEVGNSQNSGMDVKGVKVQLYYECDDGDERLLGEQYADLLIGQTKELKFRWRTDSMPKKGILKAIINPDMNPAETTYINNVLTAGIETRDDTHLVYCTDDETNSESITGTYRYKVRVGTDEDGDPVYEWRTGYYYEYLTMEIIDIEPKTIKAGEGFTFKVKTHYEDENPATRSPYNAPRRVRLYVPDRDDPIELEPVEPLNSWDNTWILPETVILPGSGDIEYRSAADESIGEIYGGRKHYTDFSTPDGYYRFKVVADRAGVNDLAACTEDEVRIKGSPFDDYVIRRVAPYDPFPAGVGKNFRDEYGNPDLNIFDYISDWLVNDGNSYMPPDVYIKKFAWDE